MIGWLACSLALVRVDAYCVAHFFTFHTFSARATIFRTPQSCKFHLHRDFSTPGIFLHKGFFQFFQSWIKSLWDSCGSLRTHGCADHFAAWVVQTHHSPRAQYMIIDRTSATNISHRFSLQRTRLARWWIWTNAAAMTIASSVKFLPLLEKVTHSIDILYREVETC